MSLPINSFFSGRVTALMNMSDPDRIAGHLADWTPEYWVAARLAVQVHGIAPLLYRWLDHCGALDLPDAEFREYLESQYRLNSDRMQRIQTILQTVLTHAGTAGVSVMPLKGAVLINGYYSDPGMRPMADIDLLVRAADSDRAGRLLESVGYTLTAVTPQHRIYSDGGDTVTRSGEHPDNPVTIELHETVTCSLGHRRYDLTEYLWTTAREGFLDLEHVFTPSRTGLFLQLAGHAAHNQYCGTLRAIQLHDICRVTELMGIDDWTELFEYIESSRLEPVVFAPLAVADRFMTIRIPDLVMERLARKTPVKLRRFLRTQPLDTFSAVNEAVTLRHLARRHSQGNLRLTGLLHRLLLKQALYCTMQLKWHRAGGEFTRELARLAVPRPEDMDAWYPVWVDRWGYFTAYTGHWILLLTAPLSLLPGSDTLRATLLNRLKQRLLTTGSA